MTTNPMGSSKFPACPNQPSTDKAGNPICFKCGKIGFARDCPKHPYKPMVYALGVTEVDETLGDLPEESEEVPEEQVELDSTEQDAASVDEEDIYVDGPYNGEITSETLFMDNNVSNGNYPAQISMMSFIDDLQDDYHIQLASAKQTKDVMSEEALVNKLIDKSPGYNQNGIPEK